MFVDTSASTAAMLTSMQSAGVTSEVKANPAQTSPEVHNRGISGLTKKENLIIFSNWFTWKSFDDIFIKMWFCKSYRITKFSFATWIDCSFTSLTKEQQT